MPPDNPNLRVNGVLPVLIGALAGQASWRVALDGNTEVSRARLFASLGERIRNVRQGPERTD